MLVKIEIYSGASVVLHFDHYITDCHHFQRHLRNAALASKHIKIVFLENRRSVLSSNLFSMAASQMCLETDKYMKVMPITWCLSPEDSVVMMMMIKGFLSQFLKLKALQGCEQWKRNKNP